MCLNELKTTKKKTKGGKIHAQICTQIFARLKSLYYTITEKRALNKRKCLISFAYKTYKRIIDSLKYK